MRIAPSLLVVPLLLLSAVSASAFAAETAAALLGAPTYLPTAERPVGWRGDGTGRYPGATPPLTWERKRSDGGYETKGILWMTPLPHNGVSTPIVVGQRVFLATEHTDLVCLDKASGRILWIRSNPEFEGLPEEERNADPAYAEKLAPLAPQLLKANADAAEELNAQQAGAMTSPARQPGPALAKKRALEKQIWDGQLAIYKKEEYRRYGPQNVFGYAGTTPVSDGKNVFAFFPTGVSVCYDLAGNRKWIAFGHGNGAEHGNFASPVLCQNQFIVWAHELRSYDATTGKLLWTNPCQPRNTYGSTFRFQSGGDWVVASQNGVFVRIRDGKLIWNKPNAFAFDDAVPTPIVERGVIYAHGGYKDEVGFKAYKIPASTDSGSVTPALTMKSDWAESEMSSKKNFGQSYTASPLCVDGLTYRITEGGGLIVNDGATGETIYRKVLPMKAKTEYWNWGGASASPTLAGKHIYLMDNQGTTVVIEPGKDYKQLAQNLIEESRDGKDQVQNLASPVFDGARMYYRTPGYLYCIGAK